MSDFSAREAAYQYLQILMGKVSTPPTGMFGEDAIANDRVATNVLRYVVEQHLHWSPQEMRYRFDGKVVEQMKLTQIVSRILYPPEVDSKDYFWYAHKCYPREIQVDFEALTRQMYNRVMNKEMGKFPNGFFSGPEGRLRAIVCLRYALSQNSHFESIEDLYSAFRTAPGNNLLRKWGLYKARDLNYDCPLDYLQDALSDQERSDLQYYLTRFEDELPSDLIKKLI